MAPGHSLADMNILAIEKVFTPGKKIIEKRESLWIQAGSTLSRLKQKKVKFWVSFLFLHPNIVQDIVTYNHT